LERLLKILSDSKVQSVQSTAIDLAVALIKDFRSSFYSSFIETVLPTCLSLLDVENLHLMDKVFALVAFGIKYLAKSIMEDIENYEPLA